MNKNRLFILVSTLTLIILLATAATCNMCGVKLSSETKATTSSAIDNKETLGEASNTEETVEETTAQETAQTSDTTKTSSSETTKSSSTNTQATAPTIKLSIYEGPTYSQADNVCYYRIEAIVTGSPTPTVTFSKDDSNGAFGSKKVQINLTKSCPNYTLTAKAKNSAGEATSTLNLTWGCSSLNNPPKIDTISIISNGQIVTSTTYDVTATAADPDGDSLSYEWTVNAGTVKGLQSNPLKWTTPNKAGTYQISLKVSDGKGGEDTKTMNIDVKLNITDISKAEIDLGLNVNENLQHVTAEEGYMTNTNTLCTDSYNYIAGDTTVNESYRGFMSFDITNLKGAIIQNATLNFILAEVSGDLSNLGEFIIETVDHGSDFLVLQDYNLAGNNIQSISSVGNGIITCNNSNLKTQLQNAITAGKTRFQLRIRFSIPTDGDSQLDYIKYQAQNVIFNVIYSK